jgi:hypothetical protein
MPIDQDESRPITLFVSRIGRNIPNLDYMKTERVTVVDVEMDQVIIRELIQLLDERLKSHITSSIRFRIYGKLVLG